jgi:hypothetical protein
MAASPYVAEGHEHSLCQKTFPDLLSKPPCLTSPYFLISREPFFFPNHIPLETHFPLKTRNEFILSNISSRGRTNMGSEPLSSDDSAQKQDAQNHGGSVQTARTLMPSSQTYSRHTFGNRPPPSAELPFPPSGQHQRFGQEFERTRYYAQSRMVKQVK